MAYELTIKTSCRMEIRALEPKIAKQIEERIDALIEDPRPDGVTKMKLVNTDGIYRIRSGGYRIIYTFGDNWVKLLAVLQRSNKTYRKLDQYQRQGPADAAHESDPNIKEALEDEDRVYQTPTFTPKLNQQDAINLPRPVTEAFLEELAVPERFHSMLLRCSTLDDLLNLPIGESWVTLVYDALTESVNLDQREQQPDFIVQKPSDLITFRESELMPFLLKLDPAQIKLTTWASDGPTMIRGGAGTGKSTVLLYRVKHLLENAPEHATVLFTTYTNALVNASKQLLEQLLTKEQYARVTVSTCDKMAHQIVRKGRRTGKMEASGNTHQILKQLLEDYVPTNMNKIEAASIRKKLKQMSARYLMEEFEWIIEGRDLQSPEAYQETTRTGRGFALHKKMRTVIWDLYQVYKQAVSEQNIERWSALRHEALQRVSSQQYPERFDFVFVDEAQDLSPVALRLMAEFCASSKGLCFAADDKQSIYSKSYKWSDAHERLNFKGRTRKLKRNFRSTRQIDDAAFALLQQIADEDIEASESIHEDTLPILVQKTPAAKTPVWIQRFMTEMSRHLRVNVHSGAVLVPNQKIGKALAEALDAKGLPARYFQGKDLDLSATVIKVMTLHTAKGLEFPMVVITGLEPGTYPIRSQFTDESVFLERERDFRKLLYVAMTRSMRGVMIVLSENNIPECLQNITPDQWNVIENGAKI